MSASASVFHLKSENGLLRAEVLSFGASVSRLEVRRTTGDGWLDVVLGFDSEAEYAAHSGAVGAVCGRYANRIGGGSFVLDGVRYALPVNNGRHHLHGGPDGFQYRRWSGEQLSASAVRLRLDSGDGDAGYPGRLHVCVTMALHDWGLDLHYTASAERATVVNLTHHGYFNLAGHAAATTAVDDHWLWIAASHVTDVDDELIPTGALLPVDATPFDFRRRRRIADGVDADHRLCRVGRGYDVNWALDRHTDGLQHVASLYSPASGLQMDCHTTEPGLQFYSGNFLPDRLAGKDAAVYGRRSGVCLETQHYPDSPNHPNFPSTVVTPAAPYNSRTQYHFAFISPTQWIDEM